MKKGLKITGSVLIIVLLAGAAFFYLHTRKPLNVIVPEFEAIEYAHISFMEDTALINADLQFENKSFLKLDVDSLIYNIKLDTLTMLSKSQYIGIKLSPSQIDTVDLPVALPFKRLKKEIADLQKQDSVGITFDLRIVYSTIFGRKSLPYKKTKQIAVPVPPKLKIEKLEYVGRKKNMFDFNAHVKIINKGKLDLHISDIAYDLIVKDNFSAKGKDQQEIHLKPSSETEVVLPIKIEFRHLFKTLVNIATDNDQVDYRLKITALAQMDKLSKKKTPLEIEKSGKTELKK